MLGGKPSSLESSKMISKFFSQSYTGVIPFKDIRDGAVILKVIQGDRPQRPATDTSRPMSDEFWDLVNMCWKHEPDGRPGMRDVVDALKKMTT